MAALLPSFLGTACGALQGPLHPGLVLDSLFEAAASAGGAFARAAFFGSTPPAWQVFDVSGEVVAVRGGATAPEQNPAAPSTAACTQARASTSPARRPRATAKPSLLGGACNALQRPLARRPVSRRAQRDASAPRKGRRS